MTRRFASLLWLLAMPALAQTEPPAAPAASPATPASDAGTGPARAAVAHVTLVTSEGPILIELEKARAPITTANFLRYVAAKRFDGTSFYRAVKVQDGYGLVQGGARNDPKRVFPNIAHEPTTVTGLSHTDGALAMARAAPGTASGDFFIVVGGFPTMDADPRQPGDNLGYAVFGHVVQGMDIVRHMLTEPTAEGGPAAMKGQMLAMPVKILSARRTD